MTLPPLPQPFPFAIHPNFDLRDFDGNRFERATRAYADRFQLYPDEVQRERLANIHCGWLGSMMYPIGSDELLQVGVDFCMWAFAYDDEYCDEGPISRDPEKFIQASAEIWRQFESPEHALSDDRYALAAQDLRIRLDRYAKPEQTGRFVESMRIYMMAEMWKAINPRPSLNDYLSIRATGGGAWSFPTLGHVIADVDVSQREHEDRRVRALFEMLDHLMAWETEPHAFLKEMTRGSNYKEHNLIRVLMRERDYAFEDAIEEYLRMRLAVLGLFVRLRADVEHDASDGLKGYIESVVRYYVGATTWSQHTRRYKSMSGTSDENAFEGGQLDYGHAPESFSGCMDVIDVPSVKWWWAYDPARR